MGYIFSFRMIYIVQIYKLFCGVVALENQKFQRTTKKGGNEENIILCPLAYFGKVDVMSFRVLNFKGWYGFNSLT